MTFQNRLRSAGFAGLAGIGILVLLVLFGARWVAQDLSANRSLRRAKTLLEKGYPVLASEELSPRRSHLIRKPDGCSTLIRAFFFAKKMDQLEWTAEACAESGQQTPEVLMAAATVRESQNRLEEAVTLLNRGREQFPSSSEIPYRLAGIFKEKRQFREHAALLAEASNKAVENAPLAYEALQAAASLQNWVLALPLAYRLVNAPTEDPDAKFLLARAFAKNDKTTDADKAVAEARLLLEKNPQFQADIQKKYPEFFKK